MKRYFITGTDTGIGKSYVGRQLSKKWMAEGWVVHVLKPVATGCMRVQDRLVSEDTLLYKGTLSAPSAASEKYTFEPPISPHIAASLAGECLSASSIAAWCERSWRVQDDVGLIEGAGGLMVPLNAHETWLDVLKILNIPVILVVGLRLGCLNQALLTATALDAEKIDMAGWVANQIDEHSLYPEVLIDTLQSKFTFPCLMKLPFDKRCQA